MTGEQGNQSTQDTDDLAALERFVVDNDDLLALESDIGRFNIFDALNIAQVEIRHSNFLAFILDPAESHGQGQLFLKAILMDLLKAAPAELRPLSPIELDGTDLRGIEVRREWEHIDLLISCQQPRFFVVIENKAADVEESADKLARYEKAMNQHYPGAQPLYVYLTPSGHEVPEDKNNWWPYSYARIYGILSRVRKTYHNAIGEDVLVFLDHYLSLIGSRFMNDPKIDELCQRIYKNHRRALELIFDRVGSPAAGLLVEVTALIQEDQRWHVFQRTNRKIAFVPKAWLEWLPKLGLENKEEPRSWIVCRLYSYDAMLDFVVIVRRMADTLMRKEIVTKLIAELPKFGFKKSNVATVKDTYTRVSGSDAVLKWKDDNEPESVTIRAAVKKKLDDVYCNLEGLPKVLKSLLGVQ